MAVQGERTKAGVRQEGDTARGGAYIVREAQGSRGNERARNGAAEFSRRLGQVAVPAEPRAEVSTHIFWKWGTTTMFDIINVNLDAGSYLHITLKKALEKADKDTKDLYLHAFMER